MAQMNNRGKSNPGLLPYIFYRKKNEMKLLQTGKFQLALFTLVFLSFLRWGLQFYKKETLVKVFSCEFCEISKARLFLQNTSGGCFCMMKFFM